MNQITIKRFTVLSYAAREAINTLCTNLSFFGKNVRRVMDTSCHASEEKSFVSMNIMRIMARLGKTAALVDADLRRSMITTKYGLEFDNNDEGWVFSHWLAGMVEEDQIIYSTNIRGAYIIPVGHEVSNPLLLLVSTRFDTLMNSLAKQVDYVIVDAPPLRVVIDAAEISKSCDGTLIVVNHNSKHQQELLNVKEQLEQSGSPILGAVLNMAPFDNYLGRKYYYKSYYYYDHH